MLFSSMSFLWIFLPVVLIGNLLIGSIKKIKPDKRILVKNYFLLICSLVFYAWGGINYLYIMIASIGTNYIGGILIDRYGEKKSLSKMILVLFIIADIFILFFFKYFNMLIIIIESVTAPDASLRNVFGRMIGMQGTGRLGVPAIVLPIGISFFTFQSMSYIIDVYRKKAKLQKNIFKFALYVSFFPQLIAGPIVQYSDIEQQLTDRDENIIKFSEGRKRFCYGLGKKVLIANTFAAVADSIWKLETSAMGFATAWVGALSYTFQIYFDFSGYSDMAIGIGRMLGFEFKENFNYPYMSCSVQEFWRRWHISLSNWFREYVYIPLGGNRKGKARTYYNIFIVFLLTGIWHGANFTFIAWGLMYAALQIIERLFWKKILDKNPVKILNWIYTMFFVVIGWVIFRSDNLYQAKQFIGQMFSFGTGQTTVLSYVSIKLILCFAAGILFSGLVQKIFKKLYDKIREKVVVQIVDFSLQLAIIFLSVIMLASGTYNPFIYFQF